MSNESRSKNIHFIMTVTALILTLVAMFIITWYKRVQIDKVIEKQRKAMILSKHKSPHSDMDKNNREYYNRVGGIR